MKTQKEQLSEYLERFRSLINLNPFSTSIKKIELFSGIRPASYYVPDLLGYLNYPPYSDRGEQLDLAWFVEIWVDGLCVWRKFRLNENAENLQQYEDELIDETIRDIITYGLNSSWTDTKKMHERQTTNPINECHETPQP